MATEGMRFTQAYAGSTVSGAQPFFLHVCYTAPHANNEMGRDTGNGMQIPSDAPYTAQPWPQAEKNFACPP